MSRTSCLLLLPIFLFHDLLLPPATSVTPPPAETTVLLSFLASLPEASQRILLPSWHSNNTADGSSPHCAFRGVTCSAAGAVTALNLSGLELTGALDACALRLCALPPEISALDLSENGFSGAIPAALAACSGVATLVLARNNLTGAVPPELLSSRQLRKLDLGSNALAGEIPVPADDLAVGTKQP